MNESPRCIHSQANTDSSLPLKLNASNECRNCHEQHHGCRCPRCLSFKSQARRTREAEREAGLPS